MKKKSDKYIMQFNEDVAEKIEETQNIIILNE
jgi:hypothetical protein